MFTYYSVHLNVYVYFVVNKER